MLLFVLTFGSFYSQNYRKEYSTTLYHNPGNQNGKNISVKFKVVYDAFMGEPTIQAIAKVSSQGDFVRYNGRTYTRQEIGDKAFDNVEIKLINVAFDIYEGNFKVSTVYLNNLISFDVSASPDWNNLWPGVSEIKAKELFKKGYSIRNARLVDVEFYTSSVENYLSEQKRKEEEAEKKRIEEERKKKEEEERLKREEQERIRKAEEEKKAQEELEERERSEKEEKEKENESQDDEGEEENEDEGENVSSGSGTPFIGNSSGEGKSAEQVKKEQADRERREYEEMVRRNNERNQAAAASAAGASIGVLYLLGEVIYGNMGYSPGWEPYFDNHFYFTTNFGYSVSSSPIIFNSIYTTLEYNSKTQQNEYVEEKHS